MDITQNHLQQLPVELSNNGNDQSIDKADSFFKTLLKKVQSFGYSKSMEEYEQRKLVIFNQLNFFQLLIGIFIPVVGLFQNERFPANAWIIACLPALVSLLVLFLNSIHRHTVALTAYFFLYPFFTCIVFMYGMNLGVDLYFILFGVLSVFFIKDISLMLLSIGFSMVSYFTLSVVLNQYPYQLESTNRILYMINQGLAILFIFYGLYLIKKENAEYQVNILHTNSDLHHKNDHIQAQADKINAHSALLKKQTTELTELNTLKNKLFSIISHDLKAPLYALRSLFTDIQHNNLPPEQITNIMPEAVKDLNYTVGLLENLLQWAKAQMQADVVYAQKIDARKLIDEVVHLLRLQAESKKIKLKTEVSDQLHVYADKDMLSLVLRNLVSNAIKFTPENGTITIGVNEKEPFVELYIMDNGTGISPDALSKIKNNDFFTTKGTAYEAGTGLGLMLCKEYLVRNGSQLQIKSESGNGSTFSFTLPKTA